VLTLALFGGDREASAHAFLAGSDPAANAILPVAPTTVVMTFTERLEEQGTSAWLVDHTGAKIDGTAFQLTGAKEITLTIPSGLANGTYSVVWKDLSSDDGHPATGYIPFTIGTAADQQEITAPTAEGASSGAPQWLRTTSRWAAFLGLFACAAIWPVWVVAISPVARRVPGAIAAIAPALAPITLAALTLGVLGNLFALLVQAAEPGGNYGDALRATLEDTRYGKLMIARFVLLGIHAVLLSFVGWVWPWRKPELSVFALGSSVALVAPFSLISHASAKESGRAFSIAGDMIHLATASIWAGGTALLLALLLVMRKHVSGEDLRAFVADVLPRFSMLAIAAWLCLVTTGVYAAWLDIGSWRALRHTDYGHAFLIKMAIALIVLGFGAFHLVLLTKRVRQPRDGQPWAQRFVRSLGLEVVAVVAVLLVTGWLTSEPPAREAAANTAPEQAMTMEYTLTASDTTGKLSLSPGTPGPNHVVLTLDAANVPADAEALLRLTSPDPSFGQQEFKLTAAGANTWTLDGSQFSLAGDWSVIAIVRKIGEFQWQANTAIEITDSGDMAHMAMEDTEPAQPWHLSDAWIPALALLVLGSLVAGWGIALRGRPNPA
jgi:copper transport protein